MALLLASPVLSDAGTLTASSQVSTFEAVNLQRMSPGLKHRSTALSFYYEGNLGSAKTIRYVGIWYANAVASTTWRVRFATSQANLTAAPAYDSGSVSFWPSGASLASWAATHSRLYLAGGQTATWYRIDIDHSASGLSYWEAARLVVAEGVDFSTFSRAKMPGVAVVTQEEEVVEVEAQDGEEVPRPKRQRRTLGPQRVIAMSKAEALGQLDPLLRERGASKDFVMVTKPDESAYPMHYMLLGRKKTANVIENSFSDWFEAELTLREV